MSERPGESPFNSERISCEYCACDDPNCLVKCKEDGRWFCNNKGRNGASHIINHLVKAHAKTIELPDSNQYSKIPFKCYRCLTDNIFQLCFVQSLKYETFYIVCTSCLNQSALADLRLDASNKQMLVSEDYCILPWLVEQLPPEQARQLLSLPAEDIDLLEEEWKTRPEVTMRDIPQIKQERSLPEIPVSFANETEYCDIFSKFIERERSYEEANAKEAILRHVHVRFDMDSAITYVRFKHPLPESCPGWTVGGDVILKSGESCEEAVVVNIAFDSTVTLRVRRSGWKPPESEEYWDIQVVFNETPFKRQVRALQGFVKRRAVSDSIRRVWLGDIDSAQECEQRTKCTRTIPGFKPLNDSQYHAVHKALNSNFTIIQGPPGTGKTTTIAGYVYNRLQAQRHDGKILVCGPSNVAVEHLTRYIEHAGVRVVRLMSRQLDDVPSITDNCTVNKLIYKMSTKSSNRLRMLQEKRINEGLSAREDREYDSLREEVELDILRRADVVCCTTVTAGCKVLDELTFPYVVVDEATQGVEPEILIPLCHGCKQLVLVGDHMQLGPTVSSKQAEKAGYGRSIVERLVELGLNPHRLTVQYRMHPAIAEFPSNYFYDGMLENGCSVSDRTESRAVFPWPERDIPMFFFDSHGGGSEERVGTSYMNRYECMLVGEIVSVLYHSGVQAHRIGIITPYAAQRNMIQDYLCSYGRIPDQYSSEIPVASVDAFQGSERDYIIMSCVRSTSHLNAGRDGIGFLKQWKRLNVALTRGRMGLVILGSVSTLVQNKMWSDLVKHFQSKNVLVEGTIEDMRPSQFVNSGSSKRNDPIDEKMRPGPYFPDDDGFLE